MSRSRAGSFGVNLLPLLDVLLCTMGTLIVVLGVVNREARLHPNKRLSGKAAAAMARQQELTDAQEELELHIRQLMTAREKTLADLQTERVRLSGIEDSSRQMEDHLRELGTAGKQLQACDDPNSPREQLRAEVMKLNARRLALDETLKKARAAAANRKPVYAVVPFEGIYQTSRRPIYIECRGDSIILQPEGIEFKPSDFLGPGGPGNPLASALRAAQEYWRQAPAPAPGIPNEPYPLLLVRPDGIIAYYLVRDAMSSWDAEFGYELIGADWKLDFPMQPEQRLKEMETRAVAEARERLQWLAQNSPETFARKSKTQYRMSSARGGVAREGGPSLGNDPFADDPLGGFGKSGRPAGGSMPGSGRGGGDIGAIDSNGNPNGNSAFGSGSSTSGLMGSGGLGSGAPGSNGSFGGLGDRGDGGAGGLGGQNTGRNDGLNSNVANGLAGSGMNGQAASGNGFGPGLQSGGGFDGGSGTSNAGPQLSSVGPRYAGTGGSTPSNGAARSNGNSGIGNAGTGNAGAAGEMRGQGSGSPSRSEYGGVAWPGGGGDGTKAGGLASGGSQSAAGGNANGSATSGQLARGGGPSFSDVAGMSGDSYGGGSAAGSDGGSSASGSMSPSGSMSSSGATSSQGSSASSSMSIGTPTPSLNYQQNVQNQRDASRSLAKNRGRNWALPNGSASSLPIQRPIRIECYTDRLVLLPDSRDQQAEVIPLADRTDESVDQLVSAVRNYTKSWGMAGRSMYWKPQLLLEVKPNAEGRASDLQTLLADSGLDVKRK